MAGFTIKYIYQAVDRFTPTLEKIQYATLGFKYKMQSVSGAVEKIGSRVEAVGKSFEKFGKEMSLRVSLPLGILGYTALESAGKMELLDARLTNLLGNADKAAALQMQLQQLNLHATPFNMDQIGDAATKLLAYGVAANHIVPTLKVLGDIAAGSKMDILTMTQMYGRIMTKPRMLKMFYPRMEARGVPIVEGLMKVTGKDRMSVTRELNQGRISALQFAKALESIASAGGKYANQMENMDRTIAGQFEFIAKSYELDVGLIGKAADKNLGLQAILAGIGDTMNVLTQRFLALPQPMQTFIFLTVAALAIIGPLALIIGALTTSLGYMIGGVALAVQAIGLLTDEFFALSVSLAIPMLPLLLIIAGLILIGLCIYELIIHLKDLWIGLFALGNIFYNVFAAIALAVSDGMASVIKWTNDAITAIENAIQAVENFFGMGDNKLSFDVNQSVSVNGQATDGSRARVDVNINDPNNRASLVQGATRGNGINLNVGRNMPYDGYIYGAGN